MTSLPAAAPLALALTSIPTLAHGALAAAEALLETPAANAGADDALPSGTSQSGGGSGPAAGPEGSVFENGGAWVTVTPRLGLAFPGTATPRQVSHTKLGFGFPLHLDAVIALADHFELGSYLHYSLRPITERGTAPTEGLRTHVVSVGAVAKARFAVSKRSRMRIGLLFGYNRTWQGFENDSFEGTITAHGLDVAPSVEWSHDIARHVAFNVQLSAITQVWGKADLGPLGAVVAGGSSQRMAYPPLAFLALGVDFCLGQRS